MKNRILIIVAFAFFFLSSAQAEGVIKNNPLKDLTDIFVNPFKYGSSGTEMVKNFMFDTAFPLFKYLFMFLALLYWSLYIWNIVVARGNEEKITNQRKNLLYSMLGFLFISLAEEIGAWFSPEKGIDEKKVIFTTEKVTAYLQVAVGAVSLILLFYYSMQMVQSQGEDDEIETAKRGIKFSAIGFIMAMLAKPLVDNVFYPADKNLGGGEISSFAAEMSGLLKFILGFLAVLAVLAIVVAGYYYVSSFAGGEEEQQGKAKTTILHVLIGLMIILSAYVLVSVFVPG